MGNELQLDAVGWFALFKKSLFAFIAAELGWVLQKQHHAESTAIPLARVFAPEHLANTFPLVPSPPPRTPGPPCYFTGSFHRQCKATAQSPWNCFMLNRRKIIKSMCCRQNTAGSLHHPPPRACSSPPGSRLTPLPSGRTHCASDVQSGATKAQSPGLLGEATIGLPPFSQWGWRTELIASNVQPHFLGQESVADLGGARGGNAQVLGWGGAHWPPPPPKECFQSMSGHSLEWLPWPLLRATRHTPKFRPPLLGGRGPFGAWRGCWGWLLLGGTPLETCPWVLTPTPGLPLPGVVVDSLPHGFESARLCDFLGDSLWPVTPQSGHRLQKAGAPCFSAKRAVTLQWCSHRRQRAGMHCIGAPAVLTPPPTL